MSSGIATFPETPYRKITCAPIQTHPKMPVTEFGPMVVKPGLDVMDESTPEGNIVTTAWKGVTSERTGPFRVYWGMEVEYPQNFWAFFDFESVEEHEKFAKEYASSDVQGILRFIVGSYATVFFRSLTSTQTRSSLRQRL